MRIPARVEYSLRALAALAACEPEAVKARTLADAQRIPAGYVYNVFAYLRRVDLVYATRGYHGGYALTRPARETTVGTVVRLLDAVPDLPRPPDQPDLDALARRLHRLWDTVNDASLRVLDQVTLADLVI